MVRTRIKFIISIMVVILATMFLWLDKSPFIARETIDPYILSPDIIQPGDIISVENTDSASIQSEIDSGDSLTSTDSSENSAETGSAYPENLADIFPEITGPLELSVEGATGWTAIEMPLYSEADIESNIVVNFDAGQVFMIIVEQGDWWYVESDAGESGWVEHLSCFINLPDVIPSIVYNITNAYSAMTRSSGYEIPGVTGQKLYDAFSFNHRLLIEEFIVPSLYSTSKLLCAAQQLALSDGNTIVIYEAYRAHESQQRSVTLLKELMETNEAVEKAINDGPWDINWFIATTMSNHQRGVAFDASLGIVQSHGIIQVGEASILKVIAYEEYPMPTSMHELSPLAVTLKKPVTSRSRDAWREVPLADTMTPGAVLLQSYFDEAGFTPLASEWWHFNDLEGVEVSTGLGIAGSFFIGDIMSVLPSKTLTG